MWVVNDGNISELGDAGISPRESFLFCLTGFHNMLPEISV
jgi:large subunit ribosomal protein L23Ae